MAHLGRYDVIADIGSQTIVAKDHVVPAWLPRGPVHIIVFYWNTKRVHDMSVRRENEFLSLHSSRVQANLFFFLTSETAKRKTYELILKI